jgi:aminomethyltransferase
MKRTPLFDVYESYDGVKLTDFGGWELPLHFSEGIIAEHMAVRERAGVFDVSHMGEISVIGPDASSLLQYLVTNNVSRMNSSDVIYSPMCYPDGTVVDDVIIYKRAEDSFLIVVNAANTQKDMQWISGDNPWMHNHGKDADVMVEHVSDAYVQIALQGPEAEHILSRVYPGCSCISFFTFADHVSVGGYEALVSRTGYTGESGFEIYTAASDGPKVWELLLREGRDTGLLPCGLGARDTLRLEAKLPLYGHEISEEITPLEANLSVFVDFESGDFCGRDALLFQKENGIPRSLRGIIMEDRGVARNGYRVFSKEDDIGYVTSGAKSPMLEEFIALVLVKRGIGLKIGDPVDIEVRGKRKRARLVKTPFYKQTGGKHE